MGRRRHTKKLRTVLLISGGGTTAEAVIKAEKNGELRNIEIIAVVSSRKEAGGLAKSNRLGIPTFVIDPRIHRGSNFERELIQLFGELDVQLISQNGWLPLTPKEVVKKYKGKIINQHPGPLDSGRADFGGKGMYGARVMCARLAYTWLTGEKNPWTEATTHWVTEKYDQGDTIRTEKMSLSSFKKSVTREELMKHSAELIDNTKKAQAILLQLEHKNVIRSLGMVSTHIVLGKKRKKPLIPTARLPYLFLAKQVAIKLFPNG